MEKKKELLLLWGFWITAALSTFLLLRWVAPLFLPFLLGLFIVRILEPLRKRFAGEKNFGYKAAGIFVLLFFYLLACFVLWAAGLGLLAQADVLQHTIGEFYQTGIAPALEQGHQTLLAFLQKLAPSLGTGAQQGFAMMQSAVANTLQLLSEKLLAATGRFAARLPLTFLVLGFTVITSFFISTDYPRITAFLRRQLPQKWKNALPGVQQFFSGTLKGVLRAYALLMLLTFAEMALGLWLLQVKSPLLLAVVLCIVDLLPVLGVGTILVPWAVLSLVQGNYLLGVGLLALWGGSTVLRQFLEPKLLAQHLGLPPVATIVAMYVGLRLGGVAGLLLAPVACLFLQYLNDAKLLRLWH